MNARWAVSALVLLAAGCTQAPTQVIVVFDAESGVRAEASEVLLTVREASSPGCEGEAGLSDVACVREERTIRLADVSFPFRIVLEPLGDDASRLFVVEGVARSETETLGGVRARSGFTDGQQRQLRLVFDDACRSVNCLDRGDTCQSGACITPDIDPEDLDPFELPNDSGTDAGDGSDTGETDTGDTGTVLFPDDLVYLKHPEPQVGDRFGAAVALSADGLVLAVGAPGREAIDSRTGSVEVFEHTEAGWSHVRSFEPAEDGVAEYGASVALSDDGQTLVVGAPMAVVDEAVTGIAERIVRGGPSWVSEPTSRARLETIPEERVDGMRYGASLAISGGAEFIFVGAPGADGPSAAEPRLGSGAVFAYGILTGRRAVHYGDTPAGAALGSAVAVRTVASTVILAMGAPNEDGTGRVRQVSVRTVPDVGNVIFVGAVGIPAPPSETVRFGAALAATPTELVIGAPERDRGDLFRWTDELSRIVLPRTPGDRLGETLAISSLGVLIGTPGAGAGDALLSERVDTTDPRSRLAPDFLDPGDEFGAAVAMGGLELAVGAPGEDSATAENTRDNSATQSGAVFVTVPRP